MTLVGDAPDLGSSPRFRARRDEKLHVLRGRDGSVWVLAVRSVSPGGAVSLWQPRARSAAIEESGPSWNVRVIAVDGREARVAASFVARSLLAAGSTVYAATNVPGLQLRVYPLPGVEHPRVHNLRSYAQVAIDDSGDEYAIWSEFSSGIGVYRASDAVTLRSISFAVDEATPSLSLSPDGAWLAVSYTDRYRPHVGDWRQLVRIVDGLERWDADWVNEAISFPPVGPGLISCGQRGVRRVDLPDGPALTLDPLPCAHTIRWLSDGKTRSLVYGRSDVPNDFGAVSVVDLDGGTPPRNPYQPPAKRPFPVAFFDYGLTGLLTAYVPPDVLATGRTPLVAFVADWQFAERAAWPAFSRDTRRVRWLEHTGRYYPSGDLLSANIADHASLTLANNAYAFVEIADGRILVADNQVEPGLHNRVVVLDERTRQAQWVAAGANAFDYTEGSDRVPVRLVGGDLDAFGTSVEDDVLLAPIPGPTH